MNAQTKQWLAVIGIPLGFILFIDLFATKGALSLFLVMGGTVGISAGFSDYPIYTGGSFRTTYILT